MDTYSDEHIVGKTIRQGRAVAVQSGSTFVFGQVVGVSGSRWQVEADLALEPGTSIDVRVELTPLAGTALASVVVIRPLHVADGEIRRYLVEVANIADEDRQRCAGWLESMQTGGTLSTFSGLSDVHLAGGRASLRQALRGDPRTITVLE